MKMEINDGNLGKVSVARWDGWIMEISRGESTRVDLEQKINISKSTLDQQPLLVKASVLILRTAQTNYQRKTLLA